MVTLPGSFAILGYAEGALALVAASTAAAWSLVLLDSACKKVNKASSASYGALVASILGPAGCYALEALTLVRMVVEKAMGDHDPDLRDQFYGHIHPQAPQWGPIGHHYNTG